MASFIRSSHLSLCSSPRMIFLFYHSNQQHISTPLPLRRAEAPCAARRRISFTTFQRLSSPSRCRGVSTNFNSSSGLTSTSRSPITTSIGPTPTARSFASCDDFSTRADAYTLLQSGSSLTLRWDSLSTRSHLSTSASTPLCGKSSSSRLPLTVRDFCLRFGPDGIPI